MVIEYHHTLTQGLGFSLHLLPYLRLVPLGNVLTDLTKGLALVTIVRPRFIERT